MLIVRSLYRGYEEFDTCRTILENLGTLQAGCSSINVPENPAFAQPCPNREYVERIGPFVQERFVGSCLAGSVLDPAVLLPSLDTSFWSRNEQRLLHGDFQAKNVLVDDSKNIAIIDLSYGNGHPLFDAAQFLVQMLRLHRRWYLPGTARRLREYGDVFLDALYAGGLAHLKRDLPFFMLWASTFSLQADSAHIWPVRQFIRRHFCASDLPQGWLRR